MRTRVRLAIAPEGERFRAEHVDRMNGADVRAECGGPLVGIVRRAWLEDDGRELHGELEVEGPLADVVIQPPLSYVSMSVVVQ